jgi:hypothetical protein
MAESGIIAEGAKAESHRANAVAFLLTQTNLYPKVMGRFRPRFPVSHSTAIAAASATGRNTIQLSLSIFWNTRCVLCFTEHFLQTQPLAARLQAKSVL